MKATAIETTTWGHIRTKVEQVSPDVAAIFDEISPDDSFKFYQISYPFGAKIIDQSVLNVPNQKGELIPITSSEMDPAIQEQLLYCTVPFGIILEKSLEVYWELEDRIFSVSIMETGSGIEMGTWEYLGAAAAYSVSAGARSLYMIPSIADNTFHKRINKHFNLSTPTPHHPYNHWQTFSDIANSANFKEDWTCEMLFLGKKWNDHLDDNSLGWQKLKNRILRKGWEHSTYGRSKILLDILWQVMVETLSRKRLKMNPYIIDILKHLVHICVADLPASIPAVDNIVAPISALQEVWLEIYRLQEYIPTIMRPQTLTNLQEQAAYYSLRVPTMLSSAPNFKNVASNIDDMRDLITLVNLLKEININNLKVRNTDLCNIINNINFTFFHEPRYAYGKTIKSTIVMAEEDENLMHSASPANDRVFSHNGPFCRGCVKINRNIKLQT